MTDKVATMAPVGDNMAKTITKVGLNFSSQDVLGSHGLPEEADAELAEQLTHVLNKAVLCPCPCTPESHVLAVGMVVASPSSLLQR